MVGWRLVVSGGDGLVSCVSRLWGCCNIRLGLGLWVLVGNLTSDCDFVVHLFGCVGLGNWCSWFTSLVGGFCGLICWLVIVVAIWVVLFVVILGWLFLVCWFALVGFVCDSGVLWFVCLWFVLTLLLLALSCYGLTVVVKVFLWLFVDLFRGAVICALRLLPVV